VTWGAEHQFDSNFGGWATVVALSSTSVAVLYDGGGEALVRAGVVSGNDVTWGSATTVNVGVGGVSTPGAAALDATTLIVAYRDWADGEKGKANICTVSGLDVTAGPASTFLDDKAALVRPVRLDDGKVLLAYRDRNDSYKGKVRVGTVSGTTVTWGAAHDFYGSRVEDIRLSVLTTGKVLVVYEDYPANRYTRAKVGVVSGNDVTFGSETVVEAASTHHLTSYHLTPDHTVVAMQSASTGKWTVVSVAGTTVTALATTQFDADAAAYNSAVVLDLPTAVVCYSDAGDTNNLAAVALDTGIVPLNPSAGWWGPGVFGSDDEEDE